MNQLYGEPKVGAPAPVFVGGSGRSGTTITASLIGQHSWYETIPSEFRYHASQDFESIPALLAGTISVRQFVAAVRERVNEQIEEWPPTVFKAEGQLWRIIRPREIEALLKDLELTFELDRIEACRRFVRGCFDDYAHKQGKPSWVEMSLDNVASAPTLLALFPRAKIINMVRDPRDVACSRMDRDHRKGGSTKIAGWIPNHWELVMRRTDRGMRHVSPDHVLTVRFEDLFVLDRDATVTRIFEFLGAPIEDGIREWFDREATPELAHVGRWKTDLESDEISALTKAYQDALGRLREEGISADLEAALPPPEEVSDVAMSSIV